MTETGTGLGTPSYMSPEQILGDKLDFRSDLFSVGIVLYQMCTGRKPFVEDESRTVMQKIRLDRYTPPRKLNPTVPRQLERILGRCMEKMPANRYPTTQALIDDLMEFLAPRVPMNYSARLVLFLRDVGVLTDREADDLLAAGAPRNVRRGSKDRSLLRHVGAVGGLLFAGMAGGGIAVQSAAGRFDEESADFSSARDALSPARAGYLRVVVEPWADVWIDGHKVATTPTAQPIALGPGRHYVKLSNPYHRAPARPSASKWCSSRYTCSPIRAAPTTKTPSAEARGESDDARGEASSRARVGARHVGDARPPAQLGDRGSRLPTRRPRGGDLGVDRRTLLRRPSA